MKKQQISFFSLVVVTLFFIIIPEPSFGGPIVNPNPVLRSGDTLPKIFLSNVLTPEDKKYLGIGEKKIFSLEDIKSDLLVIKYLNTNCVYCIKLLPTFNDIHRVIGQDENLMARIKIIGISAGDTPLEVEAFKKSHSIPFRVVPDPDFRAHKAVGEPRVPFIVVAAKDKQGQWVVATVHVGLIFSAEHFIGELKTILAIDPETLKMKKSSP